MLQPLALCLTVGVEVVKSILHTSLSKSSVCLTTSLRLAEDFC